MNTPPIALRINALLDIGRLYEAEKIALEFLATSPDNFDALEALARCLLGLGRVDEALTVIDKALAVRPESAHAHYLRSYALLGLNRPNAAVSAGEQAVSIDPMQAHFHVACARAHLSMGSWNIRAQRYWPGPKGKFLDRCVESSQRALELDPDNADAMLLLANGLHRRGETDDAISLHERALRANPSDPQILFEMGRTMIASGDYEAGGRDLVAAVQLDPSLAANAALALRPQSWRYLIIFLVAFLSLIAAISLLVSYLTKSESESLTWAVIFGLVALALGWRVKKTHDRNYQSVPDHIRTALNDILRDQSAR